MDDISFDGQKSESYLGVFKLLKNRLWKILRIFFSSIWIKRRVQFKSRADGSVKITEAKCSRENGMWTRRIQEIEALTISYVHPLLFFE